MLKGRQVHIVMCVDLSNHVNRFSIDSVWDDEHDAIDRETEINREAAGEAHSKYRRLDGAWINSVEMNKVLW